MHQKVPDQKAACSCGELHCNTIIMAQVVEVLTLVIERVRVERSQLNNTIPCKLQSKMLVRTQNTNQKKNPP